MYVPLICMNLITRESSPKKTEASKLTANHVGLSSKKEKIEQDLFYSEFSRGIKNGRMN
jgi:hypothetical protein